MNKTTSSGGPEESWDPFVYLAPTELNDLLAKRRIRDAKENILLKVDCFSEATGSSYIEIGTTKILAVVYGPREVPRKDDYDFKVANLNCEFRFTSFACFMQRGGTNSSGGGSVKSESLDEKNLSSVIEEALKPSILLHKYPKSQIDLYLLCLENDLDNRHTLAASVCSASMALANASIELYDMVPAFTYAPTALTLAYMPQLNQITSVYFSNQSAKSYEESFSITSELFKSHVKEAIENCKKIYSYMRYVLINTNNNVSQDQKTTKNLMDTES